MAVSAKQRSLAQILQQVDRALLERGIRPFAVAGQEVPVCPGVKRSATGADLLELDRIPRRTSWGCLIVDGRQVPDSCWAQIRELKRQVEDAEVKRAEWEVQHPERASKDEELVLAAFGRLPEKGCMADFAERAREAAPKRTACWVATPKRRKLRRVDTAITPERKRRRKDTDWP
eukprot:TRINITY_DN89276_c0_g1_i1.p1 TRINITY_DN89276_c0_g1~~TRINITY_DN89276_c0_g1_i1.p1  ORF type:complete len:200 (-),score=32.77 TRINITY_DN89276_c0_g1_i1:384-908(-)